MSCRICHSGVHGEKDTDEEKPFPSHPEDRRTEEGRSRRARPQPFPSFPPPRPRIHSRPRYDVWPRGAVGPRDSDGPRHPIAQPVGTWSTFTRDDVRTWLRWSSTQSWRRSRWHVAGSYPVRRYGSRA